MAPRLYPCLAKTPSQHSGLVVLGRGDARAAPTAPLLIGGCLLLLELLLHALVQLHRTGITPAVLGLNCHAVEDSVRRVFQDRTHVGEDDRRQRRHGLRGEVGLEQAWTTEQPVHERRQYHADPGPEEGADRPPRAQIHGPGKHCHELLSAREILLSISAPNDQVADGLEDSNVLTLVEQEPHEETEAGGKAHGDLVHDDVRKEARGNRVGEVAAEQLLRDCTQVAKAAPMKNVCDECKARQHADGALKGNAEGLQCAHRGVHPPTGVVHPPLEGLHDAHDQRRPEHAAARRGERELAAVERRVPAGLLPEIGRLLREVPAADGHGHDREHAALEKQRREDEEDGAAREPNVGGPRPPELAVGSNGP
mmetsp:Transcript_17284/g.52006  ORF Transcript_17284/g.52006 Transcript_17284/m.52006 type:complete len:367 (-) Transcript_17284:746-1846(-)